MASKNLIKVVLCASEEFNNKEITLTFCTDTKNLINKRFYVNLIDLVKTDKYYYKVYFRIVDVQNGIAKTIFDKVEALRESISKYVFVGIDKLDLFSNVKLASNDMFRLKYIATFKRITSSKEREIRKIFEKKSQEIASKMNLKDFIKNFILTDKANQEIRNEIKKIAVPIFFGINKIERIKSKA
jgi:ribosomal protein S3AE